MRMIEVLCENWLKLSLC